MISEPVLLKKLRKMSFVVATLISIVGGIYHFVVGDSESVMQAKQYCLKNKKILSVTGTIKTISLRKTTSYYGNANYSPEKEYKFNIFGEKQSIVVLLRAEYPNGFEKQASKYSIIRIFE